LGETADLEAAAAHLVPLATAGDEAALDELLRRCRDTIYRWALVQTAEHAEAEDATQEVLIRLHRSLHRYAGRSRFTTWLYRVTRNQALSLRRRATARLRLTDAMTREAAVATTIPPDPLERAHAAEVVDMVEILLHELPRRQREVFHLADLEGCAIDEIAARLGTSPSTARVHLFHARRAVRTRILERRPEWREGRGE
jgi:RNA polymerase sigma-70 factor (ECF subfamily)